jgi:hypothetical protein
MTTTGTFTFRGVPIGDRGKKDDDPEPVAAGRSGVPSGRHSSGRSGDGGTGLMPA